MSLVRGLGAKNLHIGTAGFRSQTGPRKLVSNWAAAERANQTENMIMMIQSTADRSNLGKILAPP